MEARMKGTEKMSFIPCKGVNFPGRQAEKIKQFLYQPETFKFSENDVITVGFPRNGNNWTFEIISMLLRRQATYSKLPFYKTLIEFTHPSMLGQDEMRENTGHETISNWTMHAPVSFLPRDVLDKKVKIVYVIRNPKDVLVSYFRLHTGYKEDEIKFDGSWDDFFKVFMSGQFLWGTWFNHVFEIEEFIKSHQQHPVFIHSFEETKTDPVTAITKLAQFLGVTDAPIEEIAQATKFQAMKKGTAVKQEEYTKNLMQDGKPGLIVKGNTGDWTAWFTDEQNREFDRKFHSILGHTRCGQIIAKSL